MIAELKNLRSQVSRAAGQCMAELYLNLGLAMEQDLEKTTAILMLRAADTNKFIRCAFLLACMTVHALICIYWVY
jgi:hypothetical protein